MKVEMKLCSRNGSGIVGKGICGSMHNEYHTLERREPASQHNQIKYKIN